MIIFKQPKNQHQYKWWAVEVRFSKPLTKKQVRVLTEHLDDCHSQGHAGTDGMYLNQWFNKYPGDWDSEQIVDMIQKIGVDAKVRAAPYGRGCPQNETCVCSEGEHDTNHRCEWGRPESCEDVGWTEADWIQVPVSP